MGKPTTAGAEMRDFAIEQSQRFTDAEARLWVCLAHHTGSNPRGECWPGITTLAKETGKSTRAVLRLLARLIDAGLIERDRRCKKPGSGQGRLTNVFRSMLPLAVEARNQRDTAVTEEGENNVTAVSRRSTEQRDNSAPINVTAVTDQPDSNVRPHHLPEPFKEPDREETPQPPVAGGPSLPDEDPEPGTPEWRRLVRRWAQANHTTRTQADEILRERYERVIAGGAA